MPLSEQIKSEALKAGFAACGIARAKPAESEAAYLDAWLAEGCQAGMAYLANNRDVRLDPAGLVPGARSVISVALNYYPAVKRPLSEPYIAYYAYGADYHVVIREKLRRLWTCISEQLLPGHTARVFTDSAPLFERYWAWKAGLGWIGKNTNLILPGQGSFFFLGEIVTTWEADAYDTPLPDRCGTCTRCLDACPTKALERPHRLNAARCLSYLTIEHRGEIPAAQAARLGNRLYGCDTCQSVCPWNRFAAPATERAFVPSAAFLSLDKKGLAGLTREEYNRIFAHSAVKRAKYEGLMRTAKHLCAGEGEASDANGASCPGKKGENFVND